IDMLLAGIPVAVWRDSAGIIDSSNYAGLAEVSSPREWLDFSREATAHPERFVESQQTFLENQKMLTDPREVHRRYTTLLAGTARRARSTSTVSAVKRKRVLFIANDWIATLQLSFLKPLAPLVEGDEIDVDLLTEKEMKEEFGLRLD